MNLIFIQPDDAVDGHRLQVANQGLNARQAARPSRDQQDIAAVMRDRLTYRMKRGGKRELTRQHGVPHLPKADVQRYAEQIKVF